MFVFLSSTMFEPGIAILHHVQVETYFEIKVNFYIQNYKLSEISLVLPTFCWLPTVAA
jgi:hypothetical protein